MIRICEYDAKGPFLLDEDLVPLNEDLDDVAGVYVILGRSNSEGSWNVVDVGKSGDIGDRLSRHKRKPCWREQGYQNLAVAVIRESDCKKSLKIEGKIRNKCNPPCGER